MLKLFFALLVATAQIGAAHKILIGNIFASTSHMIPLSSLAEGLLEQGHHVTFVVGKKFSVIPKKAKQLVLQGISCDLSTLGNNLNQSAFDRTLLFDKVNIANCEAVSSNEVLAHHLREQKYDVFIVSTIFQQCFVSLLVHHQPGVPYIMYLPGTIVPAFMSRVSGDSTWDNAYVPIAILAATEQMTFMQRFNNFLMNQAATAIFAWMLRPLDAILLKNVGEGLPSVYEVEKNASFLFINTNFEYEYALPVTPDVVLIGCMQCRPGRQLPQKFRKFIDGHKKNGIIVFSLGTVLSASSTPPGLLDNFIEAFKEMPQGVIFHTDEKRQNLPKNVITESWLPLQDILADPDTKAIISHGGYTTLQETIYHGVPYLGLPIMGESTDRSKNVLLAEYRGLGLHLEVNNVTKAVVLDKLNQLLNNKRFKENALRLSNMMKNKLVTSRDEAVYRVNFAIRHKGNTPFKSYARHLTTIQYYSLDVVAALLALIVVILYVLGTILRLIWSLLRYVCCGKKLKQQ